ncbi:hypothetical protein N7468_002798 [Penicillium chermesinum]|uniref:DUF890 domain protein n=1 Tax=Penicillium chermesinum TaxID=63820 RepID=A0A9W9PJA8_9EURO|nr:uncharacterized protein N7468_002798 [Penicillium chermesinum]KAJ5247815.1 hypothetical protein N7468_002798 [Penicillium chermesinum]
MEPARALYKGGIDFKALALQSPEFAKHLSSSQQLDFNDPEAVRQLTITLLRLDFGLEVKLPEDRLCPPVPNRLNYILWVQDLLDSTTGKISTRYDPERKVLGLDIGTGCCSIYPLLGCKARPHWAFLATDIDENNIRTSKENVALNQLQSRIRIIQTDPQDSLFPLDKLQTSRLDFTMCNPPFYKSRDEMIESAEIKANAPSSICTGDPVEMITPGGEVAFVTRMIDESLQLRDRIQWYTSMLGSLSSLNPLIETLQKHGNHNYAVKEFVQGNKTKRWAIAWSWTDMRPAMTAARGIPKFAPKQLPFPADLTFTLPMAISIDAASAGLNAELSELPWYWLWDQRLSAGVGYTSENVWSRQARRKAKLAGEDGSASRLPTVPEKVALGVRIKLTLARGNKHTEQQVQVLISWVQGADSVLFESFCGMVKRKLGER